MRTYRCYLNDDGEVKYERISNMALVRELRNNELRKSDVLMRLPSDRLTDTQRSELIAFREELRNLPQLHPGNARKCDDAFPAWPDGLEELWEAVVSGS